MIATTELLTGQVEDHLVRDPESACLLHEELVEPLTNLRRAARVAGFDMAIASGFRSFERQCSIWNDKVAGRRAVLDDHGKVIDLKTLNDWGKVQAILRWSALPGASRHHWGTDLDVFDRNGLSALHLKPELTPAECEPGGPFHAFHCWLDQTLGRHGGFYRPYEVDRGGVGPEPWHISYQPLAIHFQEALSADILGSVIEASSIALRETVLAQLDSIHQRYVVLSAKF